MLSCNKDKIPKVPDSCFLFAVLCDPGEGVRSRAPRVGKMRGVESERAVDCVKIRGHHLLSSVYNNRTKVVSDQTKFITFIEIKSGPDGLTPDLLCRGEIKHILGLRETGGRDDRCFQICSHLFSNKVQKQGTASSNFD